MSSELRSAKKNAENIELVKAYLRKTFRGVGWKIKVDNDGDWVIEFDKASLRDVNIERILSDD